MFRNECFNWAISKSTTHFEIKSADNDPEIPKITLQEKKKGIAISLAPYRILYDAGAISDNFCSVKISFNTTIPKTLVQSLRNIHNRWINCTEKLMETTFEMSARDKAELEVYFSTIEDYFLKTENPEYTSTLTELFNRMRDFIHLKHREITCDADEINEVDMAKSAFGRGSNTAKSMRVKS